MLAAVSACLLVALAAADKGPPAGYRPAPAAYAPDPYAKPHKPHGKPYEEPIYKDEDVLYNYGYTVQDAYFGTAFSKKEQREGRLLEGEYKVALPDSTIQIVRYRADPVEGFVAEVSYEGTPVYPEYKPEKKKSGYRPAPKHYAPEPKHYAPEPKYPAPAPAYKATPAPYAPPPTSYKAAPSYTRPRYAPAPKPTGRYAAAVKARTYQA